MGRSKRDRTITRLLNLEGIEVVDIVHSHRHVKFHIRGGPDNKEAVLITSSSPSDRRALMNIRSDARRLVR